MIPFFKNQVDKEDLVKSVNFENFNHPRFQILADRDDVFQPNISESTTMNDKDALGF